MWFSTFRPKPLGLVLLVLLASLALPVQAQQTSLFTQTLGFATKTGFRGVFAWKSTQPVTGVVHYGLSPASLTQSAAPIPGAPDTAQMAIGQLIRGETYYFQVEDTLTGQRSAISSFKATNAYTDWNGATYTLDLVVQLDLDSLPPDIPSDQALSDIAAGINVFAERVYDALDGYARIGKVLITDTDLDYSANVPAQGVPLCPSPESNLSDILVMTTVPFDSHTFGGFAIDNPCTNIYLGRIGQLVVPWEDDLHFGYTATHEMMHYGFNTPDLYFEGTAEEEIPADCRNLAWDGSIMHNTGGFTGKWELTELDRNPTLTPCDHGSLPWSWDQLLARYTKIPAYPDGPIDDMFNDKARGNPDGGALEIYVLDREPGGSTLTAFTPDDQVPECGNQTPQVTDPEGDATGFVVVGATPLPSEPALDVTRGFLTWDPAAEAVTFHIEVSDLSDTPPLGSVGEFFRFFFTYAGANYQVTAARDPLGQSRDMRTGDNTGLAEGLAGTFDPATDEITVVLTADQFAAAVPAAPRFVEGAVIDSFQILGQRSAVAVVLTAETATGSCSYRIGQERLAPNRPPVAVADTASTTEDSTVNIAVLPNDSDPDGDALSVQSVGASDAGGSVTKNSDGTARYAPPANFFGTDGFSYTLSDGHGGSASARVTVTVTPVQDPPAAAADTSSTAAGQPVTIDVLANDSDPDGDTLTITGVTQGSGGRVTHDGTRVTYLPGGGFVQSDSFTYAVSDGHGGSATGSVTVFRDGCSSSFFDDLEPAQEPGWTFENLNTLPVTQTWRLVPDPLAKSLTNSFFSDGTDASANKDDRMTAPAQQIGPHTTLRFWHRFRTEATFDGGVIEVSTNGGATYVDVTAAGGAFVTGGYNGTSNALNSRPAWTGASAPTMSEVMVNLGALAGTSARLRWRLVTDANLGDAGWWVDDVRFTDTISSACPSPNHLPVAADDEGATNRGTAVNLAVLANDSDPDGDPLHVSAVTDPPGGSVTNGGSSVTYTPDAGFSGTDVFSYTVSDGYGGTDQATVTVLVNGPPVAVDDSGGTAEDQVATIDVITNDTDPDGDPLTLSEATAGAHGTTRVNGDGTVSYLPAADYNGTDSFRYTVSDGRGGVASANVTVTVSPVNDAPMAVDDGVSGVRHDPIDIAVLANDGDVDGDALTLVSVTRPNSGTAKIRPDGTIRYRPRGGFSGTDSFTYTVTDGNGGISTATVTVTVTGG
ncbi:MAG TPA: Ig-like domain-containing protein [Candidatus Polarisedimenticolia bacterium]|jgi:hypothetical protein